MSIDFKDIFKQKTGMFEKEDAWSDEQIEEMFDQAAFKYSCKFATPYTFDDTPVNIQYAIILMAAIEYWWIKVSSYTDKSDFRSGGVGKVSTTLFDKAYRMIKELENELDVMGFAVEGSGDILVGDFVKRSKFSGKLIPRADDPSGNWLS